MSLQEKLDAARAAFEARTPAATLAILHRSTDELVASGQATRALKAGDHAPPFALIDPDDKPVTLANFLAEGPIVLTFYRGVWCPFCNLDLQALEAARDQIEARGVRLVAVSQQTPANSRKSQRDNKLGFSILTDRGGSLAASFGIRWNVGEDLKSLYLKFGVDLPAFNGESSWTLPMPARYVIDRDGVIAYAEVNPDYTQRPEPSDLLPILDQLMAVQERSQA